MTVLPSAHQRRGWQNNPGLHFPSQHRFFFFRFSGSVLANNRPFGLLPPLFFSLGFPHKVCFPCLIQSTPIPGFWCTAPPFPRDAQPPRSKVVARALWPCVVGSGPATDPIVPGIYRADWPSDPPLGRIVFVFPQAIQLLFPVLAQRDKPGARNTPTSGLKTKASVSPLGPRRVTSSSPLLRFDLLYSFCLISFFYVCQSFSTSGKGAYFRQSCINLSRFSSHLGLSSFSDQEIPFVLRADLFSPIRSLGGPSYFLCQRDTLAAVNLATMSLFSILIPDDP